MNEHQVEFQPIGRRGPCVEGETLLSCARHLGVELIGLCDGRGKCKSCKVRTVEGRFSEITPLEREAFTDEELEHGWRLACQAKPLSQAKVEAPPESLGLKQRIQVEGLDVEVPPDSRIESRACRLAPPSLAQPTADAENLRQAAGDTFSRIDFGVLADLSTRLREWNWNLTAHVRDRELIGIGPVDSPRLGLAVDLGSTKIAGRLVDLDDGRVLASQGIMNPQISYGEDIITRITFAIRSEEGRSQMAGLVREALDQLAKDLCAAAGVETGLILEAVIVGNTAMHHLLLNLPVRQLARSPFVPALRGEIMVKARDLDLNLAPGAWVYLPPNIAGFVGSDHVAALAATAGRWEEENVIVIDIGTNTEISLIAGGRISSVSCASGPVFEGYHIKDGMRASPGAIENVFIEGGEVRCKTIENAPAAGICGSGILDAVAQLLAAGVLDASGRMQAGSHPNVIDRDGRLEFILVPAGADGDSPAISVTQKDVREIQLGKGAIGAALRLLAQKAGVSGPDISQVVIAGAFGSFLDIPNAVAIGLLPRLPLHRFQQVGNAAGIGAKIFLMSEEKRRENESILARTGYVEMAGTAGYNKAFSLACLLEPLVLESESEAKSASVG